MVRGWKDSRVIAAGLFLLTFAYLYWVADGVLRSSGDEGIYLEGGRRIALGQQPYRDFFVLTGPLTFWVEGLLARSENMALSIMRIPVIFDAAFLTGAVYWLLSKYAGPSYSAGAALIFLACVSRDRLLNVNHRWDSGALAAAAAIAALEAYRSRRKSLWAAAGILTAGAALATPSMLILAVPLLAWCWFGTSRGIAAFVVGGLATGLAAAGYLQFQGALLPMIQSMEWTAANYTAPNRVFYGSVLFGKGAAAGLGIWSYGLSLVWEFLPSIAPPAAIAGWACYWLAKKKSADLEILALLGVAAALVISAWPRWTSDALVHTMSISWFLCSLLLYRATTAGQRFWLCAVALVVSASTLAVRAWRPLDYLPLDSRVGTVLDPGHEGEFLAGLERWVRPGDSLFVFPYLPSMYYFLNARNPSRYSFLQPGMMTTDDERRVLAELKSTPPHWVIYEKFPPEAVLAIWPGSDPRRIPMEILNGYIAGNYRSVEEVAGPWGSVTVMTRATPDR